MKLYLTIPTNYILCKIIDKHRLVKKGDILL